jgi:hypothetical protein
MHIILLHIELEMAQVPSAGRHRMSDEDQYASAAEEKPLVTQNYLCGRCAREVVLET